MITEDYKVISPAYGRDNRSGEQATRDFRAGFDFKMESPGMGGTYCSIRDFATNVKVEIRYSKLTKCVIVTV